KVSAARPAPRAGLRLGRRAGPEVVKAKGPASGWERGRSFYPRILAVAIKRACTGPRRKAIPREIRHMPRISCNPELSRTPPTHPGRRHPCRCTGCPPIREAVNPATAPETHRGSGHEPGKEAPAAWHLPASHDVGKPWSATDRAWPQ